MFKYVCVCVCVPNESGGCGDSALAVPQWPTLFRCYNQGGRGSWPGHPGVSAALDTQVLQPNPAPERRGSGLFNKKKQNKMKKTRIWPHDDVPHSDFQFTIVIISVGLGGWGRGGGGGSTAYGSAAFRQRLNDVFAA